MVYLRKSGSRKRKNILSRIRDSVSSPSVNGISYDDALLSTGNARSPLAREYFVTILPNSKKRLSSIQDLRSPYSGSKIPRIHSGNTDIYMAFHQALLASAKFNFRVICIIVDGVQGNRQLQNRYFTNTDVEIIFNDFIKWMQHPCYDCRVYFIFDPSHMI